MTFFPAPSINEKGDLSEYGFDVQWNKHFSHPDTHAQFLNESVPNFINATEYVKALHEKLPNFGIVGWDVVFCKINV